MANKAFQIGRGRGAIELVCEELISLVQRNHNPRAVWLIHFLWTNFKLICMNLFKIVTSVFLLIIFPNNSFGQITVEKSGDEYQGFQKIEVNFENALHFESSEYNFRVNLISRTVKSFTNESNKKTEWSHWWELEAINAGFFENPYEEYSRMYIKFEDGEIFSGIPKLVGDSFWFLQHGSSNLFTANNLSQARDKFLNGSEFTIRLYHELRGDSYIELKSDKNDIENILKFASKLDSLSQ